jgi:hypothetical protein
MSRVLLAVLCLFALTGCAADFEGELTDAGYVVRGVDNDRSRLTLDLEVPGKWTDADLEKIAKLAWTDYPDDFDELWVRINGEDVMSMLDNELTDAYGPKP